MAGLSFLPGANPSPEDQSSATALTPGQSAISTISLNLPRILGARPLTNPGMLGGGATGATHAQGIDPQQIVMQALMRSAMATGEAGTGGFEDELKRRLEGMFGAPTTPNMAPPSVASETMPAPSAPAPIFTPGSQTHQSKPFGDFNQQRTPMAVEAGFRRK